LSADEQLIEQARLLAKSQHKTLNAMFREWLEQFTARSGGTQEFDALGASKPFQVKKWLRGFATIRIC
jgi:hypothetical protein